VSISTRSQLRSSNPYLAWAVQYILDVASRYGGQHSITSVNRTAQEQWDLYNRPNSLAVRPGCSQHQYRAAVDVKFEDPAWQNWYLASVRNFGLTTVRNDPVHVQLLTGAAFRAWAQPYRACPDPRFPTYAFTQSLLYQHCGPGATSMDFGSPYGNQCVYTGVDTHLL